MHRFEQNCISSESLKSRRWKLYRPICWYGKSHNVPIHSIAEVQWSWYMQDEAVSLILIKVSLVSSQGGLPYTVLQKHHKPEHNYMILIPELFKWCFAWFRVTINNLRSKETEDFHKKVKRQGNKSHTSIYSLHISLSHSHVTINSWELLGSTWKMSVWV